MTLLEQLEQVEERMEHSFLQNRFDTFNQLCAERLLLLKQAQALPDKDAFFELAHKQTARWVELLGKRVKQSRQQQVQSQALCEYGGIAPRSGRVVNRSL